MTVPLRIQRRRTRGWRMPPNTVCVCRPGKWGNEWRVVHGGFLSPRDRLPSWPDGEWWVEIDVHYAPDPIIKSVHLTKRDAQSKAVELFGQHQALAGVFSPLTGRNLACWCALCPTHAAGKPLSIACDACDPCHADLLGMAANSPTEEPNS